MEGIGGHKIMLRAFDIATGICCQLDDGSAVVQYVIAISEIPVWKEGWPKQCSRLAHMYGLDTRNPHPNRRPHILANRLDLIPAASDVR